MQKVTMLLVAILITFASIVIANQDDEVEKLTWDREHIDKFKKADIPVYVPSFVASSENFRRLGHLFVSKLEVSKDHYVFQISRQRVRDRETRMLTFDVMTMSAGMVHNYWKNLTRAISQSSKVYG